MFAVPMGIFFYLIRLDFKISSAISIVNLWKYILVHKCSILQKSLEALH